MSDAPFEEGPQNPDTLRGVLYKYAHSWPGHPAADIMSNADRHRPRDPVKEHVCR